MCGIAGIIADRGERRSDSLGRMLRSLGHRGPDAQGMIEYGRCALGHTRLSIVDLAGSPQPMTTPDREVALTFNGEIYGYQSLRGNLGHYRWRTAGDTELLLALYQKHGTGMMAHLPGMFAFAIWDESEHLLFCARDRFGEKPLFYARGPSGELVLGSEIKAILASGIIDPVVSPDSVRHYLRRGYVHPTQTIYRNIHALPPASRLVFHRGRLKIDRYWQLPELRCAVTMEEAAAEFRRLFNQSVGRQLVADVPVGVFLSGGLDSSSIVAAAAEQGVRCRTFSFGFGESINELPYARGVAEQYNTEHHELSDENADIATLLRKMQEVYDEPFGDSACIPTFLLSGLARKHITVALAGEGADELTGGYGVWYRPAFNYQRANRLPASVAGVIRMLAAAFKLGGSRLPRSLRELREGFFLRNHYQNILDMHYDRSAYFGADDLRGFGFDEPPHPECVVKAQSKNGLDSVLRADLTDYLPGDILTKTDRASMAHGLEMRCPFLDRDFAEFCISLPTNLKMTASEEKAILRKAFSESWPPAIRARTKQGFGAPVGEWLRRPAVRELRQATLGDRSHRLYSIIDYKRAEKFANGVGQPTWLLLNLALWLEGRRSLDSSS